MSEPLKDFTTVVPFWQPRVTPVELENATDEQLQAMKVTVSNTKIGEYTLVLAQDPETLQQRTPLFNGIMYSRGGLSRAETELGAVAASVVNRCIYCAAVHANRYNQLTKDETVMDRIFASGEDADIDPRQLSFIHAVRFTRETVSIMRAASAEQLPLHASLNRIGASPST